MCQTILSMLAVAVMQSPAPPPQFPTPPPPQFPAAPVAKSELAYPVRSDLLEKAKAISKTDFTRFTADELKSLFAPMNNVNTFEPLVYITRLHALEYDKAVPAVTARTFRSGDYHAGHDCPNPGCDGHQTTVGNDAGPEHEHTCPKCGTTWRHMDPVSSGRTLKVVRRFRR